MSNRTREVYELAAVTTVCTDRDGADSVALNAAVNTLLACGERTTAYVRANLSANAATLAITVLLYDPAQTFIGVAAPGTQTVTAGSYKTDADNQDYEAPVAIFDLAGASYYEVRTGDASSGTRTVKTWAV